MAKYTVRWQICELEADSPEDACKEAKAIQQDLESIATEFTVQDAQSGKCWYVDLMEEVVIERPNLEWEGLTEAIEALERE